MFCENARPYIAYIALIIFNIRVLTHAGSRLRLSDSFVPAHGAMCNVLADNFVRCRPVFPLVYLFGVILAIASLLFCLGMRESTKKEYRRISIDRFSNP